MFTITRFRNRDIVAIGILLPSLVWLIRLSPSGLCLGFRPKALTTSHLQSTR